MTTDDLMRWVAAYERAWRTPGTEPLRDLFAPDARYSPGPYEQSVDGLAAIAEFWEATRDGAQERFELAAGPVAVEGDVGVVRVRVDYAGPPPRQYQDLWIVTLRGDGRARAFEEWPFHPGQPISATEP